MALEESQVCAHSGGGAAERGAGGSRGMAGVRKRWGSGLRRGAERGAGRGCVGAEFVHACISWSRSPYAMGLDMCLVLRKKDLVGTCIWKCSAYGGT